MGQFIPFRLHLTGDTADHHQFQGYDGYMALAGFAWTLSLITNYVETAEIRHRGDFPGRHAVRATPPTEGSVIADFLVWLENDPVRVLGLSAASLGAASFLYDVTRRVLARNVGESAPVQDPAVQNLLHRRDGDLEALVARTEASVRQAHDVIGSGASQVSVLGGFNVISNFNRDTKEYVKANIRDEEIRRKRFSVPAFNANHGSGSVYDRQLGRTIPISMSRDVLAEVRSTFSWALDQYANRTGATIQVTYSRILAMDDTPKKYIVHAATR